MSEVWCSKCEREAVREIAVVLDGTVETRAFCAQHLGGLLYANAGRKEPEWMRRARERRLVVKDYTAA